MKLLQHFKELTVNPKNAQELKGLILQLAIQGKLTANWRIENSEIQSTSIYLEKLKAEKENLIKEKKIRKEKSLSKIKKEELINNLPKKWEMIRLGEIGDWGAGSTPLRSNSLFYDGVINWFKSGELNNGIIDYESKEKITELAIQKSSVRLNKPGDVLIAMYGATIGKTAILNIEGTTNQAVCACTPFSCISNTYLHLLLKALKDTFINQGEGGAQPNISRVKIRNQAFALPPLEEQKEIVNVVETLFKEVEQLEQLTVDRIGLKEDFVTSALRQLTTNNTKQDWAYLQTHFKAFFNETSNIKKLRETVLQLAVQGKLTQDWRTRHPELVSGSHHASQLLKRIQEEKAQLIKDKKIKKEKALPKITKEDIPYALPEGWVWCRIIDVCERVTDGFHHTPTKLDKGIRYISATHIKENGILWNDCHFIGEKEHSELFRKASQGKGDVLIVNRGAGCGTPAIVDIDEPFSFQNAALIGFNENHINSHYMNNFILQKRTEIMNIFTNGGAQPMLSNKILKTLLFPFPPIEEQSAIIKKVNALMGLCDSLEQEVQESQEHSAQLIQSCLRAVFGGEKELV